MQHIKEEIVDVPVEVLVPHVMKEIAEVLVDVLVPQMVEAHIRAHRGAEHAAGAPFRVYLEAENRDIQQERISERIG